MIYQNENPVSYERIEVYKYPKRNRLLAKQNDISGNITS